MSEPLPRPVAPSQAHLSQQERYKPLISFKNTGKNAPILKLHGRKSSGDSSGEAVMQNRHRKNT
jgi:hypothetical protein